MADIIRSCVACRQKQRQETLYRFVCKDHEIRLFDGAGRSFYICKICIDDDKKLVKSTRRICKTSKDLSNNIKTALSFNNL